MKRHLVCLIFSSAFALAAFLPTPGPTIGCIFAAFFFLGSPIEDAIERWNRWRAVRRPR